MRLRRTIFAAFPALALGTLHGRKVIIPPRGQNLGTEPGFSLLTERIVRALNPNIDWQDKPRSIKADNGPEYIIST